MALKSATKIRSAGDIKICILAGGLSSRMGCDKRRILLPGAVTMLETIERIARGLGCPAHVLRKDRKPGFGPLGGIDTALHRTTASAVLFLACDMPLLTPEFLRWFLKKSRGRRAVFTLLRSRAGFPFLLARDCRDTVERELSAGRLSLANLAEALEARMVSPPVRYRSQLANVNTPEDLAKVVHKT